MPGVPERQTHGYARNGTTNISARSRGMPLVGVAGEAVPSTAVDATELLDIGVDQLAGTS